MIKKIGIDIIENKRIRLTPSLLNRVLSANEFIQFQQITSKLSKINFVAGRWAVKEAIIKTLDVEEQVVFSQLDIGYNNQAPVITNPSFRKILISISHEKKYSVGMAVREHD